MSLVNQVGLVRIVVREALTEQRTQARRCHPNGLATGRISGANPDYGPIPPLPSPSLSPAYRQGECERDGKANFESIDPPSNVLPHR